MRNPTVTLFSPPGSLAARTSAISKVGGSANNSEFLVSNAGPPTERWASLSSSVAKAAKAPNVVGPRRNAYQTVEAGCRWTIGSPSWKKRSTAASFPDLASNRASAPTVTMVFLLFLMVGKDAAWTPCSHSACHVLFPEKSSIRWKYVVSGVKLHLD